MIPEVEKDYAISDDPTIEAFADRAPAWVLVDAKMGIQICDQPGRVNLILPPPISPTNVILAGPEQKTLCVTCGGKLFKRKTKLTAAKSWAKPVMPPKPRL